MDASRLLARVDHLVYAGPDLSFAVERIEALLGVPAAAGGSHPGWGTRNALVALGPATYLEVIGPDPAEPAFRGVRPFGINGLSEPRLVTWAAAAADLDRFAHHGPEGGPRLGEVLEGNRRTPDGRLLAWRFTDPFETVAGGTVPLLIDWGATPHPASGWTGAPCLVELRAEHPEPGRVTTLLERLGLPMDVSRGPVAALVATLATEKGRVELR